MPQIARTPSAAALGQLLVATRNPGKFGEYRDLLVDLPAQLTSLEDKGIALEVEEVGRSYQENAVLKARAYARVSRMVTLADDSGLEVAALGGAPGLLTSRYAGPGASDEERYRLLLRNLEGTPPEERAAVFKCVTAVASPRGQVWTAEGSCHGTIASGSSGSGGFGYDPVFYLPEHGATMAELSSGVKNRISHRARATQAIRTYLEDLLAEAPGIPQ